MTLHAEVVKIALKEQVDGVKEVPLGSNTGPRVKQYQAATWLGGTGWPWCAAYATWCWKQAGHPLPYRGAGVDGWWAWAKKAGWAVDAKHAEPGDFVVFSGHMAILRTRVTGVLVRTLDGNVSDRVGARERPVAAVRGYIHIPEPSKPQPKVKEPWWELVRSERGHTVLVFRGPRQRAQKLLPGWLKRWHQITIKRGRK